MSQRIQKINELIKRELGTILKHEIEMPENSLITISYVKTSKDLTHAKVFISIFPIEIAHKIIRRVSQKIGRLQQLLNQRLFLKYVPKITFVLDMTEEDASQVEEALGSDPKIPQNNFSS